METIACCTASCPPPLWSLGFRVRVQGSGTTLLGIMESRMEKNIGNTNEMESFAGMYRYSGLYIRATKGSSRVDIGLPLLVY